MAPFASNLSAQYFITHSTFRHNYQVNGPQLFFVDSTSRIGQPDLTFHTGSENGPIAGACQFHRLSSDTEIGLTDPRHPGSMAWQRMSRQGVWSDTYHFHMGFVDQRPRSFTWKSTRSMGSGWGGDLKLVDDATQHVVAIFSTAGLSMSKTGQLDIYANYGERFQLKVLMSALAIHEKKRRASKSRGRRAGAMNIMAGANVC